MQKITPEEHGEIIERCLEAYLRSGTFDLSLDQLASSTGITKRRLLHYFGSRPVIEERAMQIFETRLRSHFRSEVLADADTLRRIVLLLWERATSAEFRNMLQLLFDVFHRAPSSGRARELYDMVNRLWREALLQGTGDEPKAEALLQLLQGALFACLVSGDAEPGRLALERLASS